MKKAFKTFPFVVYAFILGLILADIGETYCETPYTFSGWNALWIALFLGAVMLMSY